MLTIDRSCYVRADEGCWADRNSPGYEGLREKILIGAERGSLHQEVALVELAPGGVIPGHYHPFEESFFVTSGSVIFAVAEKNYLLQAGDYGFAPVATPHAWRNSSDEVARWIRIRAPQPRRIGSGYAVYSEPHVVAAERAERPEMGVPWTRYVGHFEEMPPYGPIVARGSLCYNIRHISARLLVEDTLGAVHHIVFLVQLPPAVDKGQAIDAMQADPVAKMHYHQYEEVYHFLSGRGLAFLGDQRIEVGPGDTILAGVGGSHAVINIGDEPLFWLETQAPRPPERDSIFWERDWSTGETLD